MLCENENVALHSALERAQDLAQVLDWALACLPGHQIFCQIGWDNATLLEVLPRHPEKMGIILLDPLHGPAENSMSAEAIQAQIQQAGLGERVLLLEGSLPTLLANLSEWFPDTEIGVCFRTVLSDYRTHLLQSLLLRDYLAKPALYLVDYCQYGSVAQANLDLIGIDPGFHVKKDLSHLGHGIHILAWDPNEKAPDDQELTYLQATSSRCLVSASPISLTFSQPEPPEPVQFYPCKYIKLENFLPSEINQGILELAIACQGSFTPSRSYSKSNTEAESLKLRRSLRLDFFYFQEYGSLLREKIAQVAPDVFRELGIENFDIQIFEMEMVASHNGCYFTIHSDNSYPQTAYRQVSCVYYFHREPKPYQGGNLRIYDTQRQKPHPPILHGGYDEVIPTNNSVVFFLSSCLHEILPVFSSSGSFTDSRFTINTWLGYKPFS